MPVALQNLRALVSGLRAVSQEAARLADGTEFAFLVDPNRQILSIGYEMSKQKTHEACYDMLASEARIATFLAVARGDLHQESWFKLARDFAHAFGHYLLLSWTGTMFEYLMPAIWMKSHPNTLLDRATRSAVRAQQKYGSAHNVPWGISEAAYSKTDEQGNYQYAAFGVPGLALNVARAGSLVVSPYSSCLALLMDPAAAIQNLEQMAGKEWLSDYGFYESADYTSAAARAFRARKFNLVRCWMVHHQGMSLASICNLLCDGPFQRWFHADRLVQASEMILQERPLHSKPITDQQPRRVMPFSGTAAKTAKA